MGLLKPVKLLRFVGCLCLLLCYQYVNAQVITSRQTLLNLKAKADTAIKKFPPEKVYLQLDRPYYSVGDTLWLKGWVVDAPLIQLSTRSGLLHVEIATDSNEVVQKLLLPVSSGISFGNITLNEKNYKPGNYIIRAYTNWMRNFGEQTFFYKRFTVTGGYEDNWTVKVRTDTTRVNGQPNVKAILQFSYVDKTPVVNKPIAMQVMNGRKTLAKLTLDTELTGTVDIDFKAPQNAKDLFLKAQVDNKGVPLNIPLGLKRAGDIDLQFMPEGGSLVAGINTKIGFKAVDTDGKGVNVTGAVMDSKGKTAVSFRSLNRGMGNFMLQPVDGEKYIAKITYGGSTKTFALPKVQASGLGIFVFNRAAADSVRVTLTASTDISNQTAPYFLIAKARGVICYASIVNFRNRTEITSYLQKNLFPTGITHIILTDDKGRTLNERLIFINHNDALRMQLTAPPQVIAKDSVDLKLLISDNTGKPVQGSFSLAVTDDARVRLDSLNDSNIITSLLLTSDLRGNIEAPRWYFGNNPMAWQAMDDLLLTQGWVSYEPPAKGIATFSAEEDYSVTGRLTNLFGKPAMGLSINLMSLKPLLTQDTLTTKDGRFKMQLPLLDTPAFILKAIKKNGKPSGIPIMVNEFQMPAFVPPAIPADMPWNVNTGDTVIKNINAAIKQRKEAEKLPEGTRLLQGVTISAKKFIKDSQNINGAGNADLVLDEKEMEAAGKKSLLNLIEEKIPGFRLRPPPKSIVPWYFVKDKFAVFIIDGFNLYTTLEPRSYIDIRDYLARYDAEAVKGIELIYSSKYNFAYLAKFYPMADITLMDFAFIEITTRSGSGPNMVEPRSIYLYKPMQLTLPAQFYKPKYTAATPAFENRPTIAWEPNVVTGADGRASVGFHAGIAPGNYTVTLQGISIDGSLGMRYFPLKVVAGAGP